MRKIIKIADVLEEKVEKLEGEIIVPKVLKDMDLLEYIDKRLENTEKEEDLNGRRLSLENERSFLLKLKERIKNGR